MKVTRESGCRKPWDTVGMWMHCCNTHKDTVSVCISYFDILRLEIERESVWHRGHLHLIWGNRLHRDPLQQGIVGVVAIQNTECSSTNLETLLEESVIAQRLLFHISENFKLKFHFKAQLCPKMFLLPHSNSWNTERVHDIKI